MPVDETAIPKSTYGEQKAEKLGLDVEYYPAAVRRGAWNESNLKPPNPKSGYVPQGPLLRYWDNQLKTRVSSTDEYATVPDTSSTSLPGRHEDWYDVDDFEALSSQDFSPREPFNWKHLDRMGEMVRDLVDQLLLKTDLPSVRKPTSTSTSTSNLEAQTVEIAQRLEKLRSSFIRLPAYSWESDSSILQEQRTALHKSLVTLCAKASPDPNRKPDRSQIELLVAKICYNLLISTNPPNIGTYNILIRELTGLKQHDLAQSVVNSFLHDCRMRPNERTIKLILDHYHSKNDPSGFQDVIDRMRASGGHMWVEAKTVYQLCSPAVRLWAISNRIGQNGVWLCQKVDRTPVIFDSLFRGSFDLKGLKATIRFIRAALREGQAVPTQVFCRVVQACLAHTDYKAARRLLKVILSAWQSGSTSIIELSPDFRHAFHQLLALCNINPASDSYPILPPFISHDAVQDMLCWFRIQSIEDSINRVQRLISSLGVSLDIPLLRTSGLGELPVRSSPLRVKGIRKALEILKNNKRNVYFRINGRSERAAKESSIRLEALQVELNDISISTANITRDVESFGVRQSLRKARWQKIRDIEAEITSQANLIILQEYEVISLLTTGLSVWYYETLTSRFQKMHAEGRLVARPLKYAMRLSKQAERLRLLEGNEMGSQNPLDAVQVEQQACTNGDTERNLGDDVGITENESNIPESHEIGHESAEPYPPRFPPPSPAEPYPPQFNISSPPAVVLPQPDSPLVLSSPRSYDTFKCIGGWSEEDAFT
jgi:hypothetical protein